MIGGEKRSNSRCASSLALVALLGWVTSESAFGALQVWTVTETRHVLRSEQAEGNRAARVGCARNEWVSFQILLRSDTPTSAVRLEAGELLGPGDARLPVSAMRLYRQHQLRLETGTYRNDRFKPDGYPDPLIPANVARGAPATNQARWVAMPFDLAAGETHGFWVDLWVPTNAPPGTYHGAFQVAAEGQESSHVPVELTVWDFTLPATPSLVTEFGSPADRLREYCQERAKLGEGEVPSDWAPVEERCAELLSDHCFNAPPPDGSFRPVAQADGSFRIPSEKIAALRAFVDRYHVNAIQVSHPSHVVKDPVAERRTLCAWLEAFDQGAKALERSNVVFYTYLRDEPNSLEDYRYVQKWGRALREAHSVVKVLVVEQTWTVAGLDGADSAWGDLYGAVDIWCPLFSLNRPASAARRMALGETVWTYTALCQGPPTPWWHIDYPLLNYRVPAWMAWRDHVTGLLYWGGMSYWRETPDPWQQAPAYTGNGAFQQGKRGIRFNGEGSLVYPAMALGEVGLVPTIRLKALRDGIEDYEYFALAERLGKRDEVEKLVRSLTSSWFQWDPHPSAYETVREQLATIIVTALKERGPNVGLPPR